MKANDTIRVTITSAESQKADALGRGTATEMDEYDFRTLMIATLHQVADYAQRTRHLGHFKAISDGAQALEAFLAERPEVDMSLLGTFTTVHQLIADHEVAPAFACPACGETDMDNLAHDGDNEVDCQTCRAHYTLDTFSPTDTRPEWFRLPGGLTFRIYAEGGAYTQDGRR